MKYLALGDSMSIDLYTGTKGGGAASRFAKFLDWNAQGAEVVDLARDGWTTREVLKDLDGLAETPDVVTLTVGGNDLLMAALVERRAPATVAAWLRLADEALERLGRILDRLHRVPLVIANTIYDPSDGSDERLAGIGIDSLARRALERYNQGVFRAAALRGAWAADLEAIFRGHGYWSKEPWLTQVIEPNMAGAARIANAWCDIWNRRKAPREP